MQAQIHAPRTGYAYNLLDNSDFRNPVNQRGQTSYTAAGYTIDRWAVTSGLTVGGAGVTSPGGNYLYQMITQAAIPAGTYTGAMGLADGTVICGSAIYTASDDACMIITNEDLSMYLLRQGTVVQLAINTITEKTIVWAALYEGEYTADTLPPYQPKGYAVELAECQRYYQVLPETSSCIFSISPQSGRYFSNSFALNPMRASPNVTFVTDDNGNIGIVQGVSLVSASEINIVYNDRVKNGILLLSTTNAAYAGLVMSFNGIQFSADL